MQTVRLRQYKKRLVMIFPHFANKITFSTYVDQIPIKGGLLSFPLHQSRTFRTWFSWRVYFFVLLVFIVNLKGFVASFTSFFLLSKQSHDSPTDVTLKKTFNAPPHAKNLFLICKTILNRCQIYKNQKRTTLHSRTPGQDPKVRPFSFYCIAKHRWTWSND